MLFHINTLEPWNGEPINNISYPKGIEKYWTDAELEAVGLARPLEAVEIPEGFVSKERQVKNVGGKLRYVDVLIAKPKPTPDGTSLTNKFFRLGLLRHGVAPSSITDKLNLLPASIEKEERLIFWEFSNTFNWDDPLLQEIIVLSGLKPNAAKTMWLAALEYRE